MLLPTTAAAASALLLVGLLCLLAAKEAHGIGLSVWSRRTLLETRLERSSIRRARALRAAELRHLDLQVLETDVREWTEASVRFCVWMFRVDAGIALIGMLLVIFRNLVFPMWAQNAGWTYSAFFVAAWIMTVIYGLASLAAIGLVVVRGTRLDRLRERPGNLAADLMIADSSAVPDLADYPALARLVQRTPESLPV